MLTRVQVQLGRRILEKPTPSDRYIDSCEALIWRYVFPLARIGIVFALGLCSRRESDAHPNGRPSGLRHYR